MKPNFTNNKIAKECYHREKTNMKRPIYKVEGGKETQQGKFLKIR